jgi:patatin-like phospholipase/acyl hydrolase
MPDRYHILSLDGGGIRGLLMCGLLERLEAEVPGFLDSVDLIAGTSTGGILALGLAAGLTPARIGDIYRDRGAEIFPADLGDALGDVDRLLVADYAAEPLHRVLLETFGDATLGDLGKHMLVPTFDLDSGTTHGGGPRSWKAKFFQNFEGDPGDRGELVADVAMRTSAAPTFFPSYQGYVDGGVVAGNPAMCALAQALDERAANQTVSRVALLSMGTGLNPHFVEGDHDWGLVQWAPDLVGIMLGGAAGLADFQCRQILARRYHRLDPVLPEEIGLDAVDRIAQLEELAATANIAGAVTWARTYFAPESPA